MDTNFTEYFSNYAKCYDDFDAESVITSYSIHYTKLYEE